MKAAFALKAVINLVPQWFTASSGGPFGYTLSLNGETLQFFSHRKLTPDLNKLIESVQAELPQLMTVAKSLSEVTAVSFIQEFFAKVWLKNQAPTIDWDRLINYLNKLGERTFENEQVSCNLVVSSGEGGTPLDDPRIQRLFDPLASSLHTFLRVNQGMNFVGYEEIPWQSVRDTDTYKFSPEFLQPIWSMLRDGEYSVHQTNRGDLIILNSAGLVAAKRKGRWKLYDVFTFKNSIVDAINQTINSGGGNNYRVGCNLFDVMFDLSFRRHGALLVYDPSRSVLSHVTNPGSIFSGNADLARTALAPHVSSIGMGNADYGHRKKRLFLELASLDGALLFTGREILAVGAMIGTHAKAQQDIGARSTAARSALYWGGFPVKISADGEILIHFMSLASTGVKSEATLEFM